MCIGCHGIPGYQASFPEVYKVPMISGQSAKYIVAALSGYKKGDRKHPTMRAIAGSLSEQDMADMAAYYEPAGQGCSRRCPIRPRRPRPQVDRAAGTRAPARRATAPTSASRSIRAIRKLAGQHADYLFVALKAYQTDGNPHVGRANPIMVGQIKPFSHPELKAIANYIASLPSELHTVPQAKFR